jgi:hypothetical protein
MNLNILPKDLVSKIFLYLQCPVSKLIKNEVEIYENDHNYMFTKIYRTYYIKNILTFSDYYFDKYNDPFEYESNHSYLY